MDDLKKPNETNEEVGSFELWMSSDGWDHHQYVYIKHKKQFVHNSSIWAGEDAYNYYTRYISRAEVLKALDGTDTERHVVWTYRKNKEEMREAILALGDAAGSK